MAGIKRIAGVEFSCEHQSANLTILRACDSVKDSIPQPVVMTKRFYINSDGKVSKTDYQDAMFFDAYRVHVNGIRPLGELLHEIANAGQRNMAIIRGISTESALESVRRKKENFPEHSDGTDWVMLDIDGVPVPEGMTPYSLDAVVWLIENKLPPQFRNTTCYYQFSSSAGICDANGTLLKSGLRVHLFFFLDRRIQGKELAASLREYCLRTGFFSIENNKGGVATVTYGIDPAPIRSSAQIHYIANPIIGERVPCLLAEKSRDGLIERDHEVVQLPVIPDDIIGAMDFEQNQILADWKVANGYVKKELQVHTANGIATSTYYKPTQEGVVRTGRKIAGVKLSTWKTPDDVCTLILDDENSPGSWYVIKADPVSARRYDGTKIPLKEFSESAYAYVRDTLEWFIDIPHRNCELSKEGYLPKIDSFASARHSLILAPTGAGKTTCMIEWMAAESKSALVIYVAQTIPLVNQMAADLTEKDIRYHHYDGFNYFYTPKTGIFLTTNESLPKIIEAVGVGRYICVVDEFHRALDDFARNDTRLNMFKSAITQARKIIYMTGTMTIIQRNMLSEIVGSILGRRMTEAEYCCYEFSSVKQYPLNIRKMSFFQSDVIDLFEGYAELHRQLKPIPRTVLIMNTSKMELFNQMMAQYGLTDQVEIVSRPENLPDEVETARTSTLPILITSPLFSIGLNFECEPEILWCRFDRLEADTSQIIQTINRANRGAISCSVRIYAGKADQRPFVFPPESSVVKMLEGMIEDESELSNSSYDMPMMLDRMAYIQYRKIEKNTGKSLAVLIDNNAFQNYVIAELFDAPKRDKEKHKQYRNFSLAGQEEYDRRVNEQLNKIGRNRPILMLLDDAKELADERRNTFRSETPRTDREIEDHELAIIMRICRFDDPAQARKVSIPRLQRLFALREPWTTERFGAQAFSRSKMVAAEKVTELIHLVQTLGALSAGDIDGHAFSLKLNQDKKLQRGFLALSTNENDFVAMQKSFATLARLKEAHRNSRSKESQQKAEEFATKLMVKLFAEIGVCLDTESEPLVPHSWETVEMVRQLKLFEELLREIPDSEKLEWGWNPQNPVIGQILSCVNCKSFYLGRCLRGNAVNFAEWGIEPDFDGDWKLWESCRWLSKCKVV